MEDLVTLVGVGVELGPGNDVGGELLHVIGDLELGPARFQLGLH